MNLAQVLAELNISTAPAGHHHARPGWAQIDCPLCSPGSGRYLLGISLSGGFCNCWQCGGQNLVTVLSVAANIPAGKIVELLRGVGWEQVRREQPVQGNLKIPAGVEPLRHIHRKYLESRGFDPDQIVKLWGVQCIGVAPRYGWRLWIPIHQNGEVVSWTTRAIGDRVEKRYDNSPAADERISAKQLLYGDDYARHAIVITEGPIDCWAIGPGAVSVMGLAYTRQQLLLMSNHPVRAICFDRESVAQRRAKKLAAELEDFPGQTMIIVLESGKDAAEAESSEIQEIRSRFLK
jgi:hypothetical protein